MDRMMLRQAGGESEKLTQVNIPKKSKEKFTLFSDHDLPSQSGSLRLTFQIQAAFWSACRWAVQI